jgi:adenosine deaminase
MTDNIKSSWKEMWDVQNKLFLQLSKMNMSLFQELLDKDGEINGDEWFQRFKENFKNNFRGSFDFSSFENNQSYFQKYLEMENKILDLFKKCVTEEKIQSLRHMYEIWLQCCEKIYHETLATQGYQQAYGAFINDLIRSK